jgi:hypothetical protein
VSHYNFEKNKIALFIIVVNLKTLKLFSSLGAHLHKDLCTMNAMPIFSSHDAILTLGI